MMGLRGAFPQSESTLLQDIMAHKLESLVEQVDDTTLNTLKLLRSLHYSRQMVHWILSEFVTTSHAPPGTLTGKNQT